MVGTSGSASERLALVTASARRRPAWICGVVGGMAVQPIGTWLPTTAATAGPAPPYGTAVKSALVVSARSRAERSGVVPMPGVAMLYLPGLDLAFLTRSAIDFTGDDGCAVNTLGDAATLEMSAKLRYGSYGIFL